jgi:hypothetical protein
MRQRCFSITNPAFGAYGGRGIKICRRWARFENFLNDMGERPKGLELDRINNDGPYGPENCRWATAKQQARNRRNTKYVSAFGESKSIAQWADDERCAISYSTLHYRFSTNWPTELALTREPHMGADASHAF